MAGCIWPVASVARDVTVCSPGEAFAQSNDQIFQAYSACSLWSMVAGTHGPWFDVVVEGLGPASVDLIVGLLEGLLPEGPSG